jgi:hypothetical protein
VPFVPTRVPTPSGLIVKTIRPELRVELGPGGTSLGKRIKDPVPSADERH